MRKTIPQRTFYFYLLLSSMTLLSVTSCFYNSNKKEESIFNSTVEKNDSEFNNIEAELLTKFNEQNLNIILVSSVVKRVKVSNEISELADKLIKDHQTIEDKLNAISTKKLIIIPSSLFERHYLQNIQLDTILYLETIKKILYNQVSNLTKLSDETTDSDYKVLALQLKVKINSNIKLVESTLHNNKF